MPILPILCVCEKLDCIRYTRYLTPYVGIGTYFRDMKKVPFESFVLTLFSSESILSCSIKRL